MNSAVSSYICVYFALVSVFVSLSLSVLPCLKNCTPDFTQFLLLLLQNLYSAHIQACNM